MTGFQPRPQDLDYPAKLQQLQPEGSAPTDGHPDLAASVEQAERRPLKADHNGDRNGDAGSAPDDSQVRGPSLY